MNNKIMGYTLVCVSGSLSGIFVDYVIDRHVKPETFLLPMILLTFGMGISLMKGRTKNIDVNIVSVKDKS